MSDIPAYANGSRIDQQWYEKHRENAPDHELENSTKRWRTLRKLAMNGRLKGNRHNLKVGQRFSGRGW